MIIRRSKKFILFLFILGCTEAENPKDNVFDKQLKKVEENESYVNYHDNGKLKEKGTYLHGLKNGYWKEYDEEGRVAKVSFYRNDTLLFSNEETDDYLFRHFLLDPIKSRIPIPKLWMECKTNEAISLCFYKESSNNGYSPNVNGFVFSLNSDLEAYTNKKITTIVEKFKGELLYKIPNPFFLEKDNILLMYRLNRNSMDITFFSFIFKRNNQLVELNLSCDTKEELFFEDLIKEMIVKIEFE